MKTTIKRTLATVLAVVMIFSLVPFAGTIFGSMSTKAFAYSTKAEAIYEENNLHKDNLKDIDSEYDTKIELNKDVINRMLKDNGTPYLYSVSYYSEQSNELIQELDTLRNQLMYLKMDTTGRNQVKIAQKEKEIQQKEAEATRILTLLNAARLEEENDRLQDEKELKQLAESVRHETRLQEIEEEFKNHNVDKPTIEPDEPTVEPDEPTVEPDEPTVEPDEPTVEPDEPTVEPDEPTVEPDEPTVDPGEPTVEPDKPSTDPVKPDDSKAPEDPSKPADTVTPGDSKTTTSDTQKESGVKADTDAVISYKSSANRDGGTSPDTSESMDGIIAAVVTAFVGVTGLIIVKKKEKNED